MGYLVVAVFVAIYLNFTLGATYCGNFLCRLRVFLADFDKFFVIAKIRGYVKISTIFVMFIVFCMMKVVYIAFYWVKG